MNKKLIALLMAGAMIAGNAMAVMADETEAETEAAATEVPAFEFDETAAAYEGSWVPFEEDGFQLYIPSDWNVLEISEEDAASVIFSAQAEDPTQGTVAVTYGECDADTDEAGVVAQLTDAGYAEVTQAVFNNIDVVTYSVEDQDAAGIAFLDGAGYIYTVTVAPVSDADIAQVTGGILYSLSPLDAGADAEVETETEAE